MEASRIQFACANPEKSQKTKEILTNIVSEEESKLEFERHRANPPPSFLVSLRLPPPLPTHTPPPPNSDGPFL